MADKKISQLTSLTGANTASDDLLVIVDTSVNENKKITVTQFQQAPVSGGLAYSIVYLDGTKTQATSAGFQFDGTNFYLTGNQYYSNNKTAYYRDSTNTPQAVITYGSDDALYFGQGTTNTRNVYYQGSQHIFYSGASEAMRVSSGNLVVATAAKGVNFTANTPAAGMTSQLLNWYEEGTWTPEYAFSGGGTAPSTNKVGYYTRVGRLVTANFYIYTDSLSSPSGNATISGLPFTSANLSVNLSGGSLFEVRRFATDMPNLKIGVTQNSAVITIYKQATNASSTTPLNATDFNATAAQNLLCGTVTYIAA